MSDLSSDVCSSDLYHRGGAGDGVRAVERRRHVHSEIAAAEGGFGDAGVGGGLREVPAHRHEGADVAVAHASDRVDGVAPVVAGRLEAELGGQRVEQRGRRSEEHTSELQSLMRNSYAGFRLIKKITHKY